MLDPASLLGGVASNVLYDVLRLTTFALHDRVAGPAEVRALRAAYQEALQNETEPTIRALLTAEGVAGRLLAPALAGDILTAGQHRALLARTLPRADAPAGFDDAMARFSRNLLDNIAARAREAQSPLANWFQLAQAVKLREEQGRTRDELVRVLDEGLSGIAARLDRLDRVAFPQGLREHDDHVDEATRSDGDSSPDDPGAVRNGRLNELARLARARCIERWQAAGVSRDEARALVADRSLGAPPAHVVPDATRPLRLILGPVGAGKSLVGLRLHLEAVARARADADAPVPIYCRARDAAGHLQARVEEFAAGLGTPRLHGASVVIDGADEANQIAAGELLSEARILVDAWPNTTVAITSRPTELFARAEEKVDLPPLTETEAATLVGRLARRDVYLAPGGMFPPSVLAAIQRPLFAVLLGIYLRREGAPIARSTADLLQHLVERALPQELLDLPATLRLLERLAILSTDRLGTPVPIAEIGSREAIQPLLRSRLVVAEDGGVEFALPVLAQWYAAQSLLAGAPDAASLLGDAGRLEAWRYPLIIATGIGEHERVSRVLAPLVESSPGMAAAIIMEGLADWAPAPQAPPPSEECGRRLVGSMQSWIVGIGPLATKIAPLRRDGTLGSLAVRSDADAVVATWLYGEADTGRLPGSLVPPDEIDALERDSSTKRFAYLGRQSSWAWRWTLEDLTRELEDLLRRRELVPEGGPLAWEDAWRTAMGLERGRGFRGQDVPFDRVRQELDRVADYASANGLDRECRARLRAYIDRLGREGKDSLSPPWPGPDLPSGRWAWGRYSDERLLAHTVAVYEAALQGYRQIVEEWFPRFASHLETMVALPARLVGTLIPARSDEYNDGPTLGIYLEPLPVGSPDRVDIELGTTRLADDVLRGAFERFRQLRPDAIVWVNPRLTHGRLDVFGADAVTEIVYDWLWDDLSRLKWVKGHLGFRTQRSP